MRKLSLSLFLIFNCLFGSAQTGILKIGDTLSDFSYKGQFPKPYHLIDLRGSYVLVHFWASWNEESRKIQKDFIDPYARYKDRKFKTGRKFYIVSVSLDEVQKNWEFAVKRDNLPWKGHVCDNLGWKSPIIQSCKIESIPANYLLDPNGIIIGKNIKKEELEEILKGL